MSLLDNIMERRSSRLENGSSATGAVAAMIGTAVADSVSGMVDVVLPGAVVNADTLTGSGGSAVPLPCICSCQAGDDVYVLLIGTDAVKTPVVLGPAGAGDRGGASGAGEAIPANAYKNNTTITTANFPNVTTIGADAFAGCTSLTAANFPRCTSTANSSTVGVFQGCTSLVTANFPSLTYLGDSTFYGCSSLHDVNISSATTIGQWAFDSCGLLESIALPKSQLIKYRAFRDCTRLRVVDLCDPARTTIPTLENLAFQNDSLSAIYINDNLVNALKADSGWSGLSSLIHGESEKP